METKLPDIGIRRIFISLPTNYMYIVSKFSNALELVFFVAWTMFSMDASCKDLVIPQKILPVVRESNTELMLMTYPLGYRLIRRLPWHAKVVKTQEPNI